MAPNNAAPAEMQSTRCGRSDPHDAHLHREVTGDVECHGKSSAAQTEGRQSLDPGLAVMYDAAEEVYRWCPGWTAQAIRHVVRNCDIECSLHGYDCETPDRYDGAKIQAVAAYAKSLAVEAQGLRDRVAELERERNHPYGE